VGNSSWGKAWRALLAAISTAAKHPEGELETRKQFDEAELLRTRFRNFSNIAEKLGLARSPKPAAVSKAQRQGSAYTRHHDKKTGDYVAPRSVGRPRHQPVGNRDLRYEP